PVITVERQRELLEAALSRQPENGDLLMQLSMRALGMVKEGVDDPLRWNQAAVAAAPRNSAARTNLFNALARKGKLEEALVCIRRAIELDGKNAKAHANLGLILTNLKREDDEALASLRKAIALDQKDAPVHVVLGDALKAQGKVEEAIECYHKAI